VLVDNDDFIVGDRGSIIDKDRYPGPCHQICTVDPPARGSAFVRFIEDDSKVYPLRLADTRADKIGAEVKPYA